MVEVKTNALHENVDAPIVPKKEIKERLSSTRGYVV